LKDGHPRVASSSSPQQVRGSPLHVGLNLIAHTSVYNDGRRAAQIDARRRAAIANLERIDPSHFLEELCRVDLGGSVDARVALRNQPLAAAAAARTVRDVVGYIVDVNAPSRLMVQSACVRAGVVPSLMALARGAADHAGEDGGDNMDNAAVALDAIRALCANGHRPGAEAALDALALPLIDACLRPAARKAKPERALAAMRLLGALVATSPDAYPRLEAVGLVQRLRLILSEGVQSEVVAANEEDARFRVAMEKYKDDARLWGRTWSMRDRAPNPVKRPSRPRPQRSPSPPLLAARVSRLLMSTTVATIRDLSLVDDMRDTLVASGMPELLSRLTHVAVDPGTRLAAAVGLAALVGRDVEACRAFNADDDRLVRELLGVLDASQRGLRAFGERWSTWKVLVGAAALSVPEAGKRAMLDAGALSLLTEVLLGSHLDQSRVDRWAAMALWNLAFLPDARDGIARSSETMEALRRIATDSDTPRPTREAAVGALWTIGLPEDLKRLRDTIESRADTSLSRLSSVPQLRVATRSAGSRDQPHVFISHAETNAAALARVRAVRDKLEQGGYRVWLDGRTTGDGLDDPDPDDISTAPTLDECLTAIEDADVMLVLVGKRYDESELCRTLAEHAMRCDLRAVPACIDGTLSGRRQTGWLGAFLGMRLYFDLSPGGGAAGSMTAMRRTAMSGNSEDEADGGGNGMDDEDVTLSMSVRLVMAELGPGALMKKEEADPRVAWRSVERASATEAEKKTAAVSTAEADATMVINSLAALQTEAEASRTQPSPHLCAADVAGWDSDRTRAFFADADLVDRVWPTLQSAGVDNGAALAGAWAVAGGVGRDRGRRGLERFFQKIGVVDRVDRARLARALVDLFGG